MQRACVSKRSEVTGLEGFPNACVVAGAQCARFRRRMASHGVSHSEELQDLLSVSYCSAPTTNSRELPAMKVWLSLQKLPRLHEL